ncbi:glycosyltransferase family 4 protein [Paenibacillus alkalitolerans]|uniref:glycosyltransferase family 4 protein n=1 Tax=Paenibacillus alkalitolerans TaxID=2799335 RepID=UPI0018F781AD|nr:glycosyltransferase family 4 protein [Paenibacillus alkalitolerans]
MKRKIVFVINYFYPDYASTGQLLTELCLELQHNFDITVIAVQPEAKMNKTQKWFEEDHLEQIRIIRVRNFSVDKTNKWSRIKFILSYFFLSLVALMKEKRVYMVYTISSPPILGGAIGTIGKIFKRTKHVYNIQDFNPEQAQAVNYSNKQWIYKAAKYVDNLSCKMADHVITVGQDMQQTLLNRFTGKMVPRNSVINNWTNEKEIVPYSKDHPIVNEFLHKHNLNDKFIIMYSGNLGLYYDLENIIKVTAEFKGSPDIAFVFIGDGASKNIMQQFVKENNITNVHFLPFLPKEFIKYSLNAADVHLVVNQRGIKGVSVPSKIYGVMASGKPILGVLERGSEAHRLIMESKSGVVVEPQDYKGIVREINVFRQLDNRQLEEMGLNGRQYLEQYLRKEASIQKYRQLLESV